MKILRWNGKDVISVGGGKGGVGKSCFSVNLGSLLACEGKKVVLVDADMDGANLHTLLGIPFPPRTMNDFFNGKLSLEETLIDTPIKGLKLLSSANDALAVSGPDYMERLRLVKALQALQTDIIIIDITAGSSMRATDYFSLAPVMCVVVQPLPTSLENAYLFLKNLLIRQLLRTFHHQPAKRNLLLDALQSGTAGSSLDELLAFIEPSSPEKIDDYRKNFLSQIQHVYLIGNGIRREEQNQAFDRFTRMIKRYLSITVQFAGSLPFENTMDLAVATRTPFIIKYPQSQFVNSLKQIKSRIMTH